MNIVFISLIFNILFNFINILNYKTFDLFQDSILEKISISVSLSNLKNNDQKNYKDDDWNVVEYEISKKANKKVSKKKNSNKKSRKHRVVLGKKRQYPKQNKVILKTIKSLHTIKVDLYQNPRNRFKRQFDRSAEKSLGYNSPLLLKIKVRKEEIKNLLNIKKGDVYLLKTKVNLTPETNYIRYEEVTPLNTQYFYDKDNRHLIDKYHLFEFYQILFSAIKNNNTEALTSILRRIDTNIDMIYANGENVVGYTVRYGSVEALRILISYGASLYHINQSELSPLEIARSIDRRDMVQEIEYWIYRQ